MQNIFGKNASSGFLLLQTMVVLFMITVSIMFIASRLGQMAKMTSNYKEIVTSKAVMRVVRSKVSCPKTFKYAQENDQQITCNNTPYQLRDKTNRIINNDFPSIGPITATCNNKQLNLTFTYQGKVIDTAKNAKRLSGICEDYIKIGPKVKMVAQDVNIYDKWGSCGYTTNAAGESGSIYSFKIDCPQGYEAIAGSFQCVDDNPAGAPYNSSWGIGNLNKVKVKVPWASDTSIPDEVSDDDDDADASIAMASGRPYMRVRIACCMASYDPTYVPVGQDIARIKRQPEAVCLRLRQ